MNESSKKRLEDQLITRSFSRPGPNAWVRVEAAATAAEVRLNGHMVGSHLGAWTPFEFDLTPWLQAENILEVHCRHVDHTTNGFLPRIGVQWVGTRNVEIRSSPTGPRPAVAQRSVVRGQQLLVDGRPFRVRGILHWGYYPELPGPWPSEEQMQDEIAYIKSLGFNLIKFCLWVPPERYYQLCDDMEMLVWQEYPVWDRPMDDWSILGEYEDFFRYDRPYPCVILRSLTCENDHLDPNIGGALVKRARELIPGCILIDNSGWLCAERTGDFHDEHVYLNNMQWVHYGKRMRGKLSKPLLLGETMCVDSKPDGPHNTALAVRRFQIETLARDLPDAGYVVTVLRDIPYVTPGIFSIHGKPKYTPEQWAWHGDQLGEPRRIHDLGAPVIGPRKGQWKCPEHTWWSPVVNVLTLDLPADLIERECVFDLLSGRVLERCEGTRVLVEVVDLHDGRNISHPLVIEFETQGQYRLVSAFRHDTPAGRELSQILSQRAGPAPEIGPLIGDALVLEDWELSFDGNTWFPVKCDTQLVNRGRNVFEGRAMFRTKLRYPGGTMTLRCEAVADYYEMHLDGAKFAEAGNPTGTWDSGRFTPIDFDFTFPQGTYEILVKVRDWTASGAMVGPVYLAKDLTQRIF